MRYVESGEKQQKSRKVSVQNTQKQGRRFVNVTNIFCAIIKI